MYIKSKFFILIVLYASFWSKSQTLNKVYYDEDLSKHRIKYELPRDTSKAEVISSVMEIIPQNHINDTVFKLLDSVTVKNKIIKLAQGYRVQVYSGQNKGELKGVKEKIYDVLINSEVYVTYKQPDYKIKVGDYMSRVEAFEAQGLLRRYFPDALIVPDIINIAKK